MVNLVTANQSPPYTVPCRVMMSLKTVDETWYQSWPSISAVEEKTIYPNQGEVNRSRHFTRLLLLMYCKFVFSEGEKFYFKNWVA